MNLGFGHSQVPNQAFSNPNKPLGHNWKPMESTTFVDRHIDNITKSLIRWRGMGIPIVLRICERNERTELISQQNSQLVILTLANIESYISRDMLIHISRAMGYASLVFGKEPKSADHFTFCFRDSQKLWICISDEEALDWGFHI